MSSQDFQARQRVLHERTQERDRAQKRANDLERQLKEATATKLSLESTINELTDKVEAAETNYAKADAALRRSNTAQAKEVQELQDRIAKQDAERRAAAGEQLNQRAETGKYRAELVRADARERVHVAVIDHLLGYVETLEEQAELG